MYSLAAILSFATLCLFAGVGATPVPPQAPPCNRLNAAFTFQDHHFFIYSANDVIVGFNANYTQFVMHMYLAEAGFLGVVTAAVGFKSPDNMTTFYLQSGKDEYSFTDFYAQTNLAPRYYSGADHVLSLDPDYQGIDAAFTRGNNAYYIAGCKYVVVDLVLNNLEANGQVEDLGIPCHPDAAWTSVDGKEAYIAKGHQAYVWHLSEPAVSEEKSLFNINANLGWFNLCDS